MGRMKTDQERLAKRLAAQDNKETSEVKIKGFREKTILRKRAEMHESKMKNDLVNGKFSQLNIPQKKG